MRRAWPDRWLRLQIRTARTQLGLFSLHDSLKRCFRYTDRKRTSGVHGKLFRLLGPAIQDFLEPECDGMNAGLGIYRYELDLCSFHFLEHHLRRFDLVVIKPPSAFVEVAPECVYLLLGNLCLRVFSQHVCPDLQACMISNALDQSLYFLINGYFDIMQVRLMVLQPQPQRSLLRIIVDSNMEHAIAFESCHRHSRAVLPGIFMLPRLLHLVPVLCAVVCICLDRRRRSALLAGFISVTVRAIASATSFPPPRAWNVLFALPPVMDTKGGVPLRRLNCRPFLLPCHWRRIIFAAFFNSRFGSLLRASHTSLFGHREHLTSSSGQNMRKPTSKRRWHRGGIPIFGVRSPRR
ncbi:hypothetical protein C8J57DRAFT_95262 [Mycena rebaudengoi]|nr:hypothetical protein C8J57DRAFT_95262 [Mycena rebaudengoi]